MPPRGGRRAGRGGGRGGMAPAAAPPQGGAGDDEVQVIAVDALPQRPPPDIQAGAATASATAAGTVPAVLHFNVEHLEYIKECLQVIEADARLAGITDEMPLTMSEGGREAPFFLEGYLASIASGGTVKAGCNFFWQNMMLDSLTSHVPVKRAKVQHMAATRFSTPAYGTDVHIAVRRGENPLLALGLLRRLSPAEPCHAMIMAIRRDVDADDEAKLQQWRRIVLSTTMVFRVIESADEFHFAHVQLRENPGIDFELIRHSALQRILDITTFAARTHKETGVKLNARALADTYAKNVTLSELSEAITESYVDMAVTVNSRLIQKEPHVFTLLLSLDEAEGVRNPLDSVCKLQWLTIRAKDKLSWVAPLLVDLYKSGALSIDQCSLRALKGPASTQSGVVDVLARKADLLSHLLRWAENASFPDAVKDKLRAVCVDVDTFRKHCGYAWQSSSSVNTTWKAGWKHSAVLMLNAIEMIIFSCDYDSVLAQHLKNRKSLTDMCETQPISELLEEIMAALAEDRSHAMTAERESIAAPVADPADVAMGPETGVSPDCGLEADPALKSIGELDDTASFQLDRFKRMARQLVQSHVMLAEETFEDGELLQRLRDSSAGRARGDPEQRTHVIIWYDQQEAGEASAQPHLRTPPLRNKGGTPGAPCQARLAPERRPYARRAHGRRRVHHQRRRQNRQQNRHLELVCGLQQQHHAEKGHSHHLPHLERRQPSEPP